MNNDVVKDVQKTLNLIRKEAEESDAETKMAILALILSTSQSVVALAKKLTEPKVKTKTVKVYVPKDRVLTRTVDRAERKSKDEELPRSLEPIKPIPPLPNQRSGD